MSLTRSLELTRDAASALRTILGIMADQFLFADDMATSGWDPEAVGTLDRRIEQIWPEEYMGMTESDPESASDRDQPARPIDLDIEEASMLLAGMAFTEFASAEFPWADMVRWTSDFITAELRGLWTDDEWRRHSGR